MKFSDNVISRIAQIVQEGMLLGLDVVDLMRQIEVEPVNLVNGTTELELTTEYSRNIREHYENLLNDAEKIKASREENQFRLFDS